MKTIEYKLKHVQANTKYMSIKEKDKKFILNQLRILVDLSTVLSRVQTEQYDDVRILLTMSNENLPKKMMKPFGRNSILSFAQGILENFKSSQRDITVKQSQGIEYIFNIAKQVFTYVDLFEGLETFGNFQAIEFVKVEAFTREAPLIDRDKLEREAREKAIEEYYASCERAGTKPVFKFRTKKHIVTIEPTSTT